MSLQPHTLGQLPTELADPVPARHAALRKATLAITLLLGAGALAGIALNQRATAPANQPAPAPPETVLAAAAPVPVASRPAVPDRTPVVALAGAVMPREEIAPPDNPFLPTPADPLPARAEGAAAAAMAGAGRGIPSLPPVSAVPAPVAPVPVPGTGAARSSAPEGELEVVGIVQGEPPLAVVRWQGQSFYLKVGDQVADTWRLVAVRERSAIFRLGEQRVEIPIQGGNS